MLLKSENTLHKLLLAVSLYGDPFELKENETLHSDPDQPVVWFFTDGVMTYYRMNTVPYVQSYKSVAVFGIPEVFESLKGFKILAESSCRGVVVSRESFIQLIEKENLWKEVCEVLSCDILTLMEREKELIGLDHYTIIRNKLIELMSYPESFRLKRRNSIYNFISLRTGISRSNIFKIIAMLVKNGRITTKSGYLVSVNHSAL